MKSKFGKIIDFRYDLFVSNIFQDDKCNKTDFYTGHLYFAQ